MFRLALIACGLTLATIASAQDTAAEYFPTALGTTWTYKVTGGGKENKFVISANAIERVADETCTRFDASVGGKTVSTEHVAVRKDGLYRVALNSLTLNPAICIAKFPAKRNEKWTEKFKYNDTEAKIELEADNENITVPAGAYKSLVVTGLTSDGKQKIRIVTWYAPKVGMVKQVLEQGDQKITLELEKFEVPKK